MAQKFIKFFWIFLFQFNFYEIIRAQNIFDNIGRQFGFDLGNLGRQQQPWGQQQQQQPWGQQQQQPWGQQQQPWGQQQQQQPWGQQPWQQNHNLMARPNFGGSPISDIQHRLSTGNLGHNVEQFLGRIGLENNLAHNLGQQIQNVASQFFAPSPDSPIPPHVQRRIIRFCTRNPNHPKCQGHPEWISNSGNLPTAPTFGGGGGGGTVDLNEMFPNWIPFRIPPIPRGTIRDFLAGVPELLKNFIPPPILGQLSEIGKQAIMRNCIGIQCRQQKPEILNQRATLAEQEASIQRILNPRKPIEQVDNEVELRLARTHQVKKALLQKAGLSDKVEPANDGVFQKDILLTEKQSNHMLNEINSNTITTGRRRKRSAIYGEENPTMKWDITKPIPYYFDESLTQVDQLSVETALNAIQSKTCIKFTKLISSPTKTGQQAFSHLYFIKISSPTFCGLSYIGRIEPANPIYLSFQCENPSGVAMHEILHSLGLNHEQLRSDREDFIKINWENVNPQNYDFFAVADAKLFTSYGVRYAYDSIMHYNSRTASQNLKVTMSAKQAPIAQNEAKMGQRYGLKDTDIAIIKKLYCMTGCEDKNIYCGVWATKDLCFTPNYKGWMSTNCQKSCGICGKI